MIFLASSVLKSASTQTTLPFTPVSIVNPALLAAGLEKLVDWDRKWFVNFNATKMELLSFTHHRETSLIPISMVDAQLHDGASQCLLGLMFSIDLRCNNYNESIAASTARNVGPLCHARRFFSY